MQTETTSSTPAFTEKQGQYLSFIALYNHLHRQSPTEEEIRRFFQVSPVAVRRMLDGLWQQGLIAREYGKARSLRVQVPLAQLPALQGVGSEQLQVIDRPMRRAVRSSPVANMACRMVAKLFEFQAHHSLNLLLFAPLMRCVAEGAYEELRAEDVAEAEAGLVFDQVVDFAVKSYVRLCALSDPNRRDFDEQTAAFRRLIMVKDPPRTYMR